MKKFIHYLFLSVAMVATFTACSDDDDPGYRLPQTLDKVNVSTISNGNTLSAIQCTYVLGADGKTVNMTLRGSAAGAKSADVPVIDPGYILPGCAEVNLTFVPTVTATGASFEGAGVSTFCTYNYRVTFTDVSVTVEFKDIVMNSGLILSDVTYTDADVDHLLELTYNGAPLMGKAVKYAPKPNEYNKATLTLSGATLDISEILNTIGSSLQGLDLSKLSTIPTAGVLPGSVTNDIEITIGENGAFSGQGETEFLTFKYSGTATASKMTLNITEATLKNATLAGTWEVPVMTEDYENDPIHLVWEAEEKLIVEPVPGLQLPMPPASLIGIALRLPLIPNGDADASVTEMLSTALKTVTFQQDGNIIAEYVDKADISKPAVKSPANLAQYVVAADGQILLFLNPQAIIMNVMAQGAKSRAEGDLNLAQFQGVVDQMAPLLLAMIQNGVPLQYTANDNGISVFLGKDMLLSILKPIAPLLTNEDLVKLLQVQVGDMEFMGFSVKDLLPALLTSLEKVINTTTELEIGINLTKGAAAN